MPCITTIVDGRSINIREIRGIKPSTLIVENYRHPLVRRVLQGETSFTVEVDRGKKLLEELSKMNPHYFDVTSEYGELVSLLGSQPRWCTENKESIRENQFFDQYIAPLCLAILPSIFLVFCLGMLFVGVTSGLKALPFVLLGLLGVLLVYAVWRQDRIENGTGTPVARSHYVFFRWAPMLWETMLEKAKEVDAYIQKHPELRRII